MSIVDKVKQMLGQNADKAKHGVEKAGDMFDRRTGGKHADKVDKFQEKAGDYIDREGGQTGQAGQAGQAGQRREPGTGGRPDGGQMP
ncbi:antitoxin [Actinomadura bangladeshensis]|uniref:Antitoxin n=1 Tax=Actinomadura bangladeshensis TaxID=453573 RepID=A0A4R4NQQ6_9ACTN|nr:antitoxin [Actinomadura bangladeshensis]TDC11921.1 antitoxin [Actinomadura bangladeshensis]